jgi:hypothetical protein
VKPSRRLRSAITVVTGCLLATGAVVLVAGPGIGQSRSAGISLAAAAATGPRIDMNVLILSDGTPWVQAIQQELTSEGVPTTVVNLGDSSRPTITGSFLSGTLSDGTPVGHFQGVVLPNDAPAQLSADEESALANYETAFSVRQVDAYLYPTGNVGTNAPVYGGSLDGTQVTVTAAAKADGFAYLKGTFNFEGTAGGATSYGYLATPLPNTATATFTPFLTATVPGTTTTGTLAGVFDNAGREQMEVSFGYNYYQLQYRYIAHALADWVTRGVHLGYWRNYLTVDYDDVFNADAEWSQTGKCTPGDTTCPAGTPDTTPIRMTAADATYAAQWQTSHKFTMEYLFNGGSSARFQVNGVDPLLTAFQPIASQFWWINHTYTHAWLGCLQDFTVNPWQCETDASGNTEYVDSDTIQGEIENNVQWAQQNGIPMSTTEFAPGEYSGLRLLPQQPNDNPNLVDAINTDGIQWVVMDASREPAMRPIGNALGLPRHPIDVFYNVATKADETSEYNWIYDSTTDGGSGLCQTSGVMTCLAPLNLKTGWSSFILPTQIRTMLGSVLQNDPRPFYMHQSNLTGDRLGYPLMNGVLSDYRAVYAASTPMVNQRISADGQSLNAQDIWAQALSAGAVSGYIQGNTVTITGPSGTSVPVTVPNATKVGTAKGAAFGTAYGGERSDYTALGSGPLTLVLKAAPYPGAPAGTTPAATGAPDTSSPAIRSTGTINAKQNPAALPKGKLGTAIQQATGGGS